MIKLKTKYKVLFLFSIFFLVAFIGILSPSVLAQTDDQSEENAQVLMNHISFGTVFAENQEYPNEAYGWGDSRVNFFYDKVGITDFLTSDIIVTDRTDTYAILETYFTLRTTVDVRTSYSADEVYYDITNTKDEFLWLELMLDPNWASGDAERTYDYYTVEYTDYDFAPDEDGHYINSRGIDADVELDIEIDPFQAYSLDSTDESTSIEWSVPLIEPIEAEIISHAVTPVGEYDDYFNDLGATTLAVQTFDYDGYTDPEDSVQRSSEWDDLNTEEWENDIQARCNSFGVWAENPFEPYAYDRSNTGILGYTQDKAVDPDAGLLDSNFGFHIRNVPQVRMFEQTIKRQRIDLGYDTHSEWLCARWNCAGFHWSYPHPSDTVVAQVGWHINQWNLRHVIDVKFKVNALLECDDPEFLDDLMSVPDIYRSDVYWNIAMTGSTDALVTLQDAEGWDVFWGNYGRQIKIALWIALFVGITVLALFITFKAKGGGKLGGGSKQDLDVQFEKGQVSRIQENPKRSFWEVIFGNRKRMNGIYGRGDPRGDPIFGKVTRGTGRKQAKANLINARKDRRDSRDKRKGLRAKYGRKWREHI